MTRPDFEDARSDALELLWNDDDGDGGECSCGDCNLARAYLSLLEAVEPLLAAAEKATPGPWDAEGQGGVQMDGIRDGYVIGSPEHRRIASLYPTSTDRQQRPIDAAFIVQARNTASALRDLLGPTGGQP